MIDAGHLRPYYCSRGENNARWYFTNPGDTVLALSRAYAYLPADLQPRVWKYLEREMASYPPLSDAITTPNGEGVPRIDFEVADHLRAFDSRFYRQLPRAHNLYAVWLYVDATGDRAYVDQHWTDIQSFANKHDADFPIYLGGAAGAIGWARLAAMAGDGDARDAAEKRAREALAAMRDEAALRQPMCARYGFGQPWSETFLPRTFHFLHVTPEVARFTRNQPETRQAILEHTDAVIEHWPMWFISQASAFTRMA
jgi:hypothetical protein